MELKAVIHAINGTQKIRLICLDQLYNIILTIVLKTGPTWLIQLEIRHQSDSVKNS